MHQPLKKVLEIQEIDMQMIRLVRLKKERQKELERISSVNANLKKQVFIKESEILDFKKDIRIAESEIADINTKFKELEAKQSTIKKVEEFNALSHEMSRVEKERALKEQYASDVMDRLTVEEETLTHLKENLGTTEESSKVLEKEIIESIEQINTEGAALKSQRDVLVTQANKEVFAIYERLLKNKKDRVVVPIENRCCSGCHIVLTAQHENLVRKGERIVFCEHCSRVHYWPESEDVEGAAAATPRQRRRRASPVGA